MVSVTLSARPAGPDLRSTPPRSVSPAETTKAWANGSRWQSAAPTGSDDELWTLDYKASNIRGDLLRMYYGWSTGDRWSATAIPASSLPVNPICTRSSFLAVPAGAGGQSSDPCGSFSKIFCRWRGSAWSSLRARIDLVTVEQQRAAIVLESTTDKNSSGDVCRSSIHLHPEQRISSREDSAMSVVRVANELPRDAVIARGFGACASKRRMLVVSAGVFPLESGFRPSFCGLAAAAGTADDRLAGSLGSFDFSRARHVSPGPRRPKRPEVQNVQNPHHASQCRVGHRSRVDPDGPRSADHPRGPSPAEVPSGRGSPTVERGQRGDVDDRPAARAARVRPRPGRNDSRLSRPAGRSARRDRSGATESPARLRSEQRPPQTGARLRVHPSGRAVARRPRSSYARDFEC